MDSTNQRTWHTSFSSVPQSHMIGPQWRRRCRWRTHESNGSTFLRCIHGTGVPTRTAAHCRSLGRSCPGTLSGSSTHGIEPTPASSSSESYHHGLRSVGTSGSYPFLAGVTPSVRYSVGKGRLFTSLHGTSASSSTRGEYCHQGILHSSASEG